MNIKNSLVKSALVASIVSVATAYASLPKQPTEPVYVMAPFKFDSIDIKNNTAAVETLDEKYSLEVKYVADVFKDGNGEITESSYYAEYKAAAEKNEGTEVIAYLVR